MKMKKLFIPLISLMCLGCGDPKPIVSLSRIEMNITPSYRWDMYYDENHIKPKLLKTLTEVKEVFCDNEFFKFECTLTDDYFSSKYIIFSMYIDSTDSQSKAQYIIQDNKIIIQYISISGMSGHSSVFLDFFEIDKEVVDQYRTIYLNCYNDYSILL